MFISLTGNQDLNFKIAAYTTADQRDADAPKENTIGIVTTLPVTGYLFSAKEPENPEKGLLWIAVGAASAVEFNALKKNGLCIYPLYAKQYTLSTVSPWEYVDARSRKGGKWVEWTADITLYANGSEVLPLALRNVTKEDTYLSVSLGKNGSASIESNSITLSGHTKVSVTYSGLTGESTFAGGIRVRVKKTNDEIVKTSGRNTSESGTIELDLSDLNLAGDYVIEVYANNSSGSYTGSCRVSELKVLR